MNPVFPHYVRRVRRKLLPPEEQPVVIAQAEQPKGGNEVPGGTPATTRETVAAPLANVLPEEANNASDTSNAGAE